MLLEAELEALEKRAPALPVAVASCGRGCAFAIVLKIHAASLNLASERTMLERLACPSVPRGSPRDQRGLAAAPQVDSSS